MGYCMVQTDCKFKIPAEHLENSIAAVMMATPAYPIDKVKLDESLSLVAKLNRIIEEGWCFSVIGDGHNVIKVCFDGEKLHTETSTWMEAIAPFVENGSYIEMCGEDGDQWRWVFNNGTMKEIRPKTIWE